MIIATVGVFIRKLLIRPVLMSRPIENGIHRENAEITEGLNVIYLKIKPVPTCMEKIGLLGF